MTSKGYEKNVYLAMLAEQCNRFEDMTDFLESMLRARGKDLNSDERNLLSIAYKNSVSTRRTALRTVMAYESKERRKEQSNFLTYIQEYRKRIEDELTKMCRAVLSTIDEHLLKHSEDDEARVFYLKMKGDYNRYIAEYATGDLRTTVSEGALQAYKSASETAASLSSIHPINLGLALNFSVFYYEVLNDHQTACKIAKETLDLAAKEISNIDEDDETHRDAMSIINLLRENLEMWRSEGEDVEN
jgi:14-3-3 protein epsilon